MIKVFKQGYLVFRNDSDIHGSWEWRWVVLLEKKSKGPYYLALYQSKEDYIKGANPIDEFNLGFCYNIRARAVGTNNSFFDFSVTLKNDSERDCTSKKIFLGSMNKQYQISWIQFIKKFSSNAITERKPVSMNSFQGKMFNFREKKKDGSRLDDDFESSGRVGANRGINLLRRSSEKVKVEASVIETASSRLIGLSGKCHLSVEEASLFVTRLHHPDIVVEFPITFLKRVGKAKNKLAFESVTLHHMEKTEGQKVGHPCEFSDGLYVFELDGSSGKIFSEIFLVMSCLQQSKQMTKTTSVTPVKLRASRTYSAREFSSPSTETHALPSNTYNSKEYQTLQVIPSSLSSFSCDSDHIASGHYNAKNRNRILSNLHNLLYEIKEEDFGKFQVYTKIPLPNASSFQ